MEDNFEDEILRPRKTIILHPQRITVNPQFTSSQVSNLLSTMV